VTEELSEVSYLDQLRLYAVDHPADEESSLTTSSRVRVSGVSLFGVKRRVYPEAAHDDKT